MLRLVVDASQIQYSKFDLADLEVDAWVKGYYLDKEGNKQQVIVPLVYLKKEEISGNIQGWAQHLFYLLGLSFDRENGTPSFAQRFLEDRFKFYLKSNHQIVGVYYDPKETRSPGLAAFLQGLTDETGALPTAFIETGDPSGLPNIPGLDAPVFPITSLGADIQD